MDTLLLLLTLPPVSPMAYICAVDGKLERDCPAVTPLENTVAVDRDALLDCPDTEPGISHCADDGDDAADIPDSRLIPIAPILEPDALRDRAAIMETPSTDAVDRLLLPDIAEPIPIPMMRLDVEHADREVPALTPVVSTELVLRDVLADRPLAVAAPAMDAEALLLLADAPAAPVFATTAADCCDVRSTT